MKVLEVSDKSRLAVNLTLKYVRRHGTKSPGKNDIDPICRMPSIQHKSCKRKKTNKIIGQKE